MQEINTFSPLHFPVVILTSITNLWSLWTISRVPLTFPLQRGFSPRRLSEETTKMKLHSHLVVAVHTCLLSTQVVQLYSREQIFSRFPSSSTGSNEKCVTSLCRIDSIENLSLFFGQSGFIIFNKRLQFVHVIK